MAALGIATALGLGLSMTLGGVVAGWWDGLYPDGDAPGGFSGWQFAFLVASLPGFVLAWAIYRLKEPTRGQMDGIRRSTTRTLSAPAPPCSAQSHRAPTGSTCGAARQARNSG